MRSECHAEDGEEKETGPDIDQAEDDRVEKAAVPVDSLKAIDNRDEEID